MCLDLAFRTLPDVLVSYSYFNLNDDDVGDDNDDDDDDDDDDCYFCCRRLPRLQMHVIPLQKL